MTASAHRSSRRPPSFWKRLKAAAEDPEWMLQQIGVGRALGRNRSRGSLIKKFAPYHQLRVGAPIVDPPSLPGSAVSGMADDEPVIAVVQDGEQRAYPWWFVDRVHVVNDRVGKGPVLIVTCGKCRSAVALDPVIDGRRLIFSATHFYAESVAVSDTDTGTVWAPFLGEAIRGPLRGRRLELLPAWQTSWREWLDRHPNTTVISTATTEAGRFRGDGHGGVPVVDQRAPWWANRLPANELVLGVIAPGGARAYSVERLGAAGGVLNDEIAGTPVVVLAAAEDAGSAAAAFSRHVKGQTLTFDPAGEGATDRETGSRWTLEGHAVDGPLAGSALRFVPSHVATWNAWAAQVPGIELAP